MKWQKKGLIYCAKGESNWAATGASLPVPHLLSDQVLRLYVAFADVQNRSRIGYVDVNPENPSEVLAVSPTPLLDIGEDGTFDENGVVPISIVSQDNQLYLYYVGFQLGVKRPYYLFSGLAISQDNGQSFQKYQETPILDRSPQEKYIRTAPFVLKENNVWKMWYLGGNEWTSYQGKPLPIYKINYLESSDGIHWGETGVLCIDTDEDIHGFGRPYVTKEPNNTYKMVYSIRYFSKNYRLGQAESKDGIHWTKSPTEFGVETSASGWDSDMICYGIPFSHKNKHYLFYNGNQYGKTGVGYAELCPDD
ncbi:MAG: hypothetical protein AB7F28_06355 [Candidatus Margulisiibacteriota bacterium]